MPFCWLRRAIGNPFGWAPLVFTMTTGLCKTSKNSPVGFDRSQTAPTCECGDSEIALPSRPGVFGAGFLALCVSRADELSSKDLGAAKKLYTSKCARCHTFYEPAGHDDREWTVGMGKMRKKARLISDQFDVLLRYTEQLRHEGRAGGQGGNRQRAGG